MKNTITIAIALGFIAGLLLSSSPALAGGTRPVAPLNLSLQLNGESIPTLGEDAGINGIRGLLLQGAGNVASVPVNAGGVYRIDCMPDGGAIHLCTSSTDGGCSADPTDINWGIPVAAGGFYYVTLQETAARAAITTTRIYATGDTATQFTCPVRPMK